MSRLLDQIRADADARLQVPAGVHPMDELDRFRRYLRLETHRLKMLHRSGAGGREICQARSLIIDLILGCLFDVVLRFRGMAKGTPPGHALVATGGYGRGELSPHSHLSLLFLHDGKSPPGNEKPVHMELLDPPVVFTLFPKVGHAVRTVPECVQVANVDFRSKTSLTEARFLGGDPALFRQLQEAILSQCVEGKEAQDIAARMADGEARRNKYGSTVCLQEPNLKNGCGGLRDLHHLLWLAYFRHRHRTLRELEQGGGISRSERQQLEQAYDFILRVRNELHYSADRPLDVLSKAVQPAVAHHLGYGERSLSRRIDRFMRDYYRQARMIFLITRDLEQRLVPQPQPRPHPPLSPRPRQPHERVSVVFDRFEFADGQVLAATPQIFRESPSRLIRAFLYAQRRGLGLHPNLLRWIRNLAGRLGPALRADPDAHRAFLEILSERGSVAPVLRAMHETGLLGAYLPPFEKLTCLVQHEFYHQYTADEHTLVCLEKLDRIASAKSGPLVPYSEIFNKEVDRPHLLYLALLLHDTGKAKPGAGHAEHSARIATTVARRMGLDPSATQLLCWLVRHHLAMIITSQRRDLEDQGEIIRFAARVGNVEQLRLLTLLSVADSLATSDQLWNGFKDTLLLTLYHRTCQQLGGIRQPATLEPRHQERLLQEVRSSMPPSLSPAELAAHFRFMPPRYFLIRGAREIVADLELVSRFLRRALSEEEDALEPVVAWTPEPGRGCSQLRVATWDRIGLFSKICGALTAAGLNIFSADICTRVGDGIALDTFSVTDAATGDLVDPQEQDRFARFLRDALRGAIDLAEPIRQRRHAQPPSSLGGFDPIPTALRFDNDPALSRTVLEVETEDRVGLLYTITRALTDMRLDIAVAKISTEKGAACDTFYLSESSPRPPPWPHTSAPPLRIEDEQRQQEIERRLRAEIAQLASPA